MHRAEGRGLTRAPTRQTTPKDKAIPHDFEAVTFYLPVFCSYCHDLTWTFSSGFKCKHCSYSVHSECQADVPPDCPVAHRRVPSGLETKATQNTFNRRGIIMEGSLWKMAKLADPWIRVWCIVKPDGVYVFRPEKREYEYTDPILVLSLADGLLDVAKVNALHEHCFMLRRPGAFHYFAANSDEERKEWKYVIKHRRPKPRLGAAALDDAGDSDWANQSWIWTPKSSEPRPFGWEDIKPSLIKMLNTVILTMNPPESTCFVPELQLSKDDPVSDKLEVDYFRAKVAKVVRAQSQKRVRLILAELTDAPIPSNFPDTFMVQLRMGKKPFRVRCSRETNLKQIIVRVLMDTTPMNMTASWALPTMEDYVVRCGGLNEFILNPDVNLLSIVYVRDAITKTRMIVFDLLPYEPQLHHMDVTAVDESPAGGRSFCSLEADETLGFDTCVMPCLNVHDVSKPFEVKVRFVENLTRQLLYESKAGFRWDSVNVFVALEVFVGETRLALRHTQPVSPGQPVWEDWLVTDLLTENIPREARLCFTLCVCKSQNGGVLEKITNLLQPAATSVPVAAASITYANFAGVLRRGSQSLPMSLFIASSTKQKLMLSVEFDATAPHPIAFASTAVQPQATTRADEADDGKDKDQDNDEAEAEERDEEGTDDERVEAPSQFEQRLLFHTLQQDALYEMTSEDKARVWKYRHYIRTQRPNALPKVLLAAPAVDRHTTAAIHALLARWAPLPPVFALELLGTRFADTEVRRFAVECLRELTDRQLVEYLPQLVQVLKSEPFHYSPLFEFLFLRSMRSIVLGHPFFWHLAAELHTTSHSARFKLMIEAFLAASDDDGTTLEMKRELEVVATFARLARELKEVPKEKRTAVLREKLRQIELPKSFLLPYNPRFEVSRLIIDKCRVMDSMTIPLWLVFENSERQTASIIFKVGDDLRADILSLQMIRIMDQLWRNEGLDLHMQPYRAVSTGKEEGIIEVVTNAETMSTISQTYGGGGARSAFSEEAVTVFLRQCNPTEAAHREAVTNFTLSCAGYCVATYILGVGDRHNDNIMLTYAGHMFHIDFAYFLGRRVTFVGIPRETAPFVLTPDFVHAMGGPGSPLFRQFETHCCRAYNIIRRHGHLFITLFAMMVPSGMAQLQGLADLDYLRRALALELTDEQAALRFTQLIRESCSNQITQLNNAVHILAHS